MSDPAASSPVDEAGLCTACGLCCDGSLFDRIKLQPADIPQASRAALPVTEVDGVAWAPFPCSFLDRCRCTIYDTRYAGCRSFRCKLLRRHAAGEITLDAALGTVAEARRLHGMASKAASAAGLAGTGHTARAAARRWQDITDAAPRLATAQAHLQLTAFAHYADTHFRKSAEERNQAANVSASIA